MSDLDLYITHGTKVFNICFSLTYRDEVIFLMLIMDTKIKHLILKPLTQHGNITSQKLVLAGQVVNQTTTTL